jgi:hypothetical protein
MIAGLLSMGVGIMQAAAQNSAAQADYAAKAAIWKQNVLNSEAAARTEQVQILNNNLEEQAKTTQKKHIYDLEGAQKAALAAAQAGSAGVGGHSVDAIVGDIEGKALLNETYADENYMFTAANLQQKLKATDTTLMSRINSVERPVSPANTVGLTALGGVAKFAGANFGNLGMGG